MFIYKYTNKISGKIYIGKTVNPKQRHACHISSAKNGSTTVFAKAIRSYGMDAFDYEIIDGANSESELAYLEVHYIHKFNCLVPSGYNLLLGKKMHPINVKALSKARKDCPKNLAMLKSLEGKRVEATGHKVIATNAQTGDVLTFRSMRECAVFAGVSFTYMQSILVGRKAYRAINGYDFELAGRPSIKRSPKRMYKRPIKRTHRSTGEVVCYESLSSISKDGFSLRGVYKYLRHERVNRTDFEWEYC